MGSWPGGELAFVRKMIDESRGLSVKVFTTMLGHKKSLGPLKQHLRQMTEGPEFVTTEFCQGKTMRWALAWTFNKHVKLAVRSQFAQSKDKKRGSEPFVLDLSDGGSLKEVHEKLTDMVRNDLKAVDVVIEASASFTFRLTRPSWRNQRSKRRKMANGDCIGVDEGTCQQCEESDETLLQVNIQILEPGAAKTVLKFTCDTEASSLGRGGLYELVQYFRNKLCPQVKSE